MDDPEIKSPLLNKPLIHKQIEQLERVVKEAERRIDIRMANDPNIKRAIECVERFLRKNQRVCYGGAAINALLPKDKRFYDPLTTIPDYDFFSPSVEEDVLDLMNDLKKEGFDDITKKLSIHEGTIKVYVNYIPVADCSQMNKEIFSIVQKRAKSVDGILYCDPDFLRMMMYIELSRPRGEVSRWKKVFERLTLLNHEYQIDNCNTKITTVPIDIEDRKAILEFCVKRKSVMVGPEFVELLSRDNGSTDLKTLTKTGGPLIFLSAAPEKDADDIKNILKKGYIKVEYNKSPSDHLYNYVRITRKGKPIAILFEEDSCHSYTTLKIYRDSEMRVGTPDTILNLYYGLMIFGNAKKEKAYFQTTLDCLIRKVYHISNNHRSNPTHFVPSFGLRCSGQQRGFAELLKLKYQRTQKKKASKVKNNTRKVKNNTRKVKNNTRKVKNI